MDLELMSDSEILRGVPAIRAFMNAIMDTPLSARQVYRAIELQEIPTTGKLLGQHTASKRAICATLGTEPKSAPKIKRSVL